MPENHIEQCLRNGQFEQAMETALREYHKAGEKMSFYDCALEISRYWLKYHLKLEKEENPIVLWDRFIDHIYSRFLFPVPRFLEAVSDYVMQKIYSVLSIEPIMSNDKNPFSKKIAFARSLLGIKKYGQANSFLLSLRKQYPKKSEPWGILGKLYYSWGDLEKGLLCYREAFLLEPTHLNIWDINSHFIEEIIRYFHKNWNLKEEKISSKEILQWIGISGVVGHFFKVKKEMTPKELEELDKRIIVYENRYKVYSSKENLLNLIRLYLFKIDYYVAQNKKERVLDTLSKLENLEPTVYAKLKIK